MCSILDQTGWLEYFRPLQGFDNEVALELKKNMDNGVEIVKNIEIQVSEDAIEEIRGLPKEGEKWYEMHTSF